MSSVANPSANTLDSKETNVININVDCPRPKPNKRVKGITVFRPILYGNISYRLERPPSKNQTLSSRNLQDDNQDWFRWTVYIRGIENEDLSYFIKKVVFHLHESYTEPIRVLEHGPFELTEEGWGQFEIKIEVFFHDIITEKDIKKQQKKEQNKKANKQHMDVDDNGNDLRLETKRSYDEIVNDKKRGIECFELNKKNIKKMIKEKQDEIMKIIPAVFDEKNKNKITLIHPLRLFAKDCSEDSKKGIIEESYTEIEFVDPYYCLFEKLMLGPHKFRQKHPFEEHWKNKIVEIANREQRLIHTISNVHTELLKKIEAAQDEYQRLIK